MSNPKIAELILKIAVAGEFIGHGVFALQQKQGWIKYFEAVGISSDGAMTLMPLIGIMDIALGIIILVRPVPFLLLWMSFWGFWT
ncbi:MAG: DoxX-like family protein, partial [Candidatus Spechtbacterales bacterium]